MDSNLAARLDKAMTEDQFNQVVNAILDGKYSWACVLILRFAGYNPLHYIPYRTYNRLMKDNSASSRTKQEGNQQDYDSRSLTLQDCLNQLEDLGYLEPLNEQAASMRGGCSVRYLHSFLDLSFSLN